MSLRYVLDENQRGHQRHNARGIGKRVVGSVGGLPRSDSLKRAGSGE
jgi:hypothetical protein